MASELEEMEKQVRRQAYKEEHGTLNPCDLCKIPLEKQADCPYFERKGSICEGLKIGKAVSHGLVATYIMQSHVFKAMVDTEEVYFYFEGYYQPNGEVVIKGEVEKLFDEEDKLTSNFVNEVMAHILRRTYTPREIFDADPNLLTVENGILDIEHGILNGFTPSHLSLSKINVNYKPKAKCPAVEKFLEEITYPEHSEKLKQFIGYLLEKSYPIPKAFMLHGPPNTGKTTFMNLITFFVGVENTSNEPLYDLCVKRFSIAYLYKKLLNACDDMPPTGLTYTERFKQLTGKSRIKGEAKHKDPFYFWNIAKLIFATNEMPPIKDLTDAFFKRWEIIPFYKEFSKHSDPPLIPHLINKLKTPEEMSGLLNLAIESLKKLREQGEFSFSSEWDTTRAYWLLATKPLSRFIEYRCEERGDLWIPQNEFYRELMEYLTKNHLPTMSSNKVTREMQKKYALTRKGSRGKQERGWLGIDTKLEVERTYTKNEKTGEYSCDTCGLKFNNERIWEGHICL